MKLLVGLGNPGERYARTRHNVGFMALDCLSQDTSVLSRSKLLSESRFELRLKSSWRERFRGLSCEGDISASTDIALPDPKLLLLKPQTFMNLSGDSVAEASSFYKIAAADICVLHDDIDLPFGAIRIRMGGGEGGHNGLKSISQMLGTGKYLRVRIGVGRPAPATTLVTSSGGAELQQIERRGEVSDWVLSRFSPDEEKELAELLPAAAAACIAAVALGLAAAQRSFQRIPPAPTAQASSAADSASLATLSTAGKAQK